MRTKIDFFPFITNHTSQKDSLILLSLSVIEDVSIIHETFICSKDCPHSKGFFLFVVSTLAMLLLLYFVLVGFALFWGIRNLFKHIFFK